jgi:hypothetical protein
MFEIEKANVGFEFLLVIDETAVENWIDRMGSSCGGTIGTEWICG